LRIADPHHTKYLIQPLLLGLAANLSDLLPKAGKPMDAVKIRHFYLTGVICITTMPDQVTTYNPIMN
jgi:hypothetical protein